MCVECTNGDKNYPRQTIQYDNYRIQLPSKCLTSLSNAAKDFEQKDLNYDDLKKTEDKTIA